MDLDIRGKKAIVCASSQGLGKACALALAREGAAVVINGRSSGPLEATRDEIRRETGAEIQAVRADITTRDGRAAVLAACVEPDILVNNAGGPPIGNFRAWDEEVWLKAVNDNMISAIMLIHGVIDGMVARRFGRIVNITSRSVRSPLPHLGLSTAARLGLTGFVAGVAREVARFNVTINNLLPGPFATARLTKSLQTLAAKAGRDFNDFATERADEVPAGRFGVPEEFGKACAFLCSADAGYLVGNNILIDGGTVNLTV